MIIQTGMRTDIPAFYSDWFANRLREGFVLVRNPYNPSSVTRYDLNPDVVDMIGFCSKNPAPMLKYMDLLKPYGQYWFVTITPYGKEIEPNVPDKDAVIAAFCRMSEIVGVNSMGWRYDPIQYPFAQTVVQFPADRSIFADHEYFLPFIVLVVVSLPYYEKNIHEMLWFIRGNQTHLKA